MRKRLKYRFNAVRTTLHTIFAAALLSLGSCTPTVDHPVKVDHYPSIYPDYIEVTIPAGIAPLNFNVTDNTADVVDVVAKGSKGGELHVSGEWADFAIEDWHQLTEQNVEAPSASRSAPARTASGHSTETSR